MLSRPAHGEGQALALRFAARFALSYRSAGACPPRTLICLKQDIQDSQDFQDEGGVVASRPSVKSRSPLQVRKDLHVYRTCFPVFKVR